MRIPRLWLAAGAAAIILGGCAASSAATGGVYDRGAAGPTQAGNYSKLMPGGVPAASAAGTAAPAGNGTGSNANGGEQKNNAPKPEDYIIKTGLIRVQVDNLDASIVRVNDSMHALGGYLAGSQRATDADGGLASVTYRIPAGKFEDALAETRKLGKKVLNEHSETTPVGGQIVDLQARIENLKTSEKAIQAIMARASSIPDVLTVEGRLSDVQGQIEQLTAQLQSLTDQATYSTLTVELELTAPAASPTPTASSLAAWSAGDEFGKASGALATIVQATVTVLIWVVVVFVPIGAGFLVLALFAVLAVRIWRKFVPAIRREAGLGPMPPAT